MIRQVAIAAIVAFSVTVLGLSLWQGKETPKPAPAAPSPVVQAAPAGRGAAVEDRVGPEPRLDARLPRVLPARLSGVMALEAVPPSPPQDAGPASR